MGLKCHYDLISQPSRAVWVYLKTSGIEFTECPVALFKGEHQSPEFLKLNPLHYVPVIDDDGFVLRECIAILRYLHEKYNGDDHWYPRDVKKRARIDEYMSWHHTGTRQGGVHFFLSKVLRPMRSGKPADPAVVEENRVKLNGVLDTLENVFLKDTDFINSSELSFADLLAYCELMQPYLGACYDCFEGRPRLGAWSQRVRSELGSHLEVAEVDIKGIGDKYKAM